MLSVLITIRPVRFVVQNYLYKMHGYNDNHRVKADNVRVSELPELSKWFGKFWKAALVRMAPAMSAMSAPCDRADWAGSTDGVGVCSIYGIGIRVKPPGCNSLEAQEQAACALPPTPNATGCTEHKHCLRLGTVLWDANLLLHSHALSLHHFRTEVNQNPASERDRD